MFMNVHGCSTTFTDFFITLKGGQHLSEGRLDKYSLGSARCEAEQHKNSKATQYNKIGKGRQTGDKQCTAEACSLLRARKHAIRQNMLPGSSQTCYSCKTHQAKKMKYSILAHVGTQISSLLFASLEIAEALSSTLSKRSGNIAPGNSRHNIVRRIPEGLRLLRNCFQQLRGMHGWECEKRFHSILAQV